MFAADDRFEASARGLHGRRRRSGPLALVTIAGIALSGCAGQPGAATAAPTSAGTTTSSAAPTAPAPSARPTTVEPSTTAVEMDALVDVGGGRKIHVRCTGAGSPTVILEGGDEDTLASYGYAVPALTEVTRTCRYDRANLGGSDPAPGPRGLKELVGDLEQTIAAAEIPGPYVLVGTSGGGYITAGYAFVHPDQVQGLVFVDVGSPFVDPPAQIVEDTRWDSPVNIEKRDYLQVEKDAWAAREEIGDIPVTVITNEYTADEIAMAEFPSERDGMRTNVEDQQGWLVLSPRATQVVVHTGHAVDEANPRLVTDAILDVVRAARATTGP